MLTARSSARPLLIALALAGAFVTCEGRPTSPEAVAPAELSLPALEVTALTGTTLTGAGDIASCSTANDEATATLLDGIGGEVFTLGDNAYATGTSTEYADCYEPTWGRHKARTHPAPGDKDYKTLDAAGYFGYFGPAAGDPAQGYYSYEVGDWHVVVLNSSLSMSATSPQTAWLKSDLAANAKECTIAYWHRPRFFSNGVWAAAKPVWDVLYASGVDIVLNAERKNYERFAKQNPDGVADPVYGIRQFIVGTGGASSSSFGTPLPTSEVRLTKVPGVLTLSLGTGTYSWDFLPIAGQTATDAGTGTCHSEPPPVANPGGPYTSDGDVQLDGSASSDPQGDALTYTWDFGDGSPVGTGIRPSHTYPASVAPTEYTVSLVVTDSDGNASAPATTTVTIVNMPPVVDAGLSKWLTLGQEVAYTATFTDKTGDGPWTYTIDWGDGSAYAVGEAPAIGSIGTPHTYALTGSYTVTVTVTDAYGAAGSDQATMHVSEPGASMVVLGAGDIAECGNDEWNLRDEATANLIDAEVAARPDAVLFTFGDNAYPNGRAQDYANCYGPSWGRHRDRTYANIGNHEYDTGTADPTWDYFGDRAGPRGKGYYSLDIGNWHIVVLNDNKSFVPFAAGSEQDQWLVADLAANTKPCTLAIFHQARFYSSDNTTTVRSAWKIFWDRLYAAGADVTLHGHQHRYERFRPMTPDGAADDVNGIRQFIVGTGGESTSPPATVAPNSEVVAATFGILKLTLHSNSYEWEFKPIPGQTFTDSGTGTCH